MQEKVILDLVELVKNMKIKSFTVNGKVYDFRSNYKISTSDEIKLSNKYVPLLVKKGNTIESIRDLLQFPDNLNFIKQDGKFTSLNVTNHALIQMLKRIVYIYLSDIQIQEHSIWLREMYEKNIDLFINLLLNEDWTNIANDSNIKEKVSYMLANSKVFRTEDISRKRDELSFRRRDEENPGTVRYLYHPYLFIVDNGMMKTVELYYHNKDMRHVNKKTSDNRKFLTWLRKIKGV